VLNTKLDGEVDLDERDRHAREKGVEGRLEP
jgi:hypothetical protein